MDADEGDELMRMIARFTEIAPCDPGDPPVLIAARAVAKAHADAKDAERYRWLRAQNWNDSLLAVVAYPRDAIKLGHDCPSLARLDEQIDAAMMAQDYSHT